MKVKQLMEALSKMDPEADVISKNTDGCSHCNEFGYENHHDVYEVEERNDFRWTRHSNPIKVVIL